MRAPLITLIVVYAISVGGLALIPGIDGEGHRYARCRIFHAFYVMSYTATTIGFGEIPYPFTDAQRLWVTFSIYLSVIGWAYTLGSAIALANDATFRALLARSVFKWRVRGIAEPFYVLCGYGQSGARLARALDRLGNRLVIVEPDAIRAARTAIQDFATSPLTLVSDARLADVLEDCGIRSPHCLGLIALAGEDAVNQAIAIGARVLYPGLQIVARAKSEVARINLESFGGVAGHQPVRHVRRQRRHRPARAGDPAARGVADGGARLALPRGSAGRRADAGCWSASDASAARSPRCSTARASSGAPSIR